MSGFFGIVREDGQHVSERLLEEVAEALRVRGPDGASIWREGRLGGCFAKMRTGPVRQADEMPLGIGGLSMVGRHTSGRAPGTARAAGRTRV